MNVAARAKPASVDEYVASLPPRAAIVVKKIRALVKKQVPGRSEVISYGIPAFKAGKVFMYCAAFKSHIGIYPPVRGDAKLVAQLKPHANAKGNLRFSLDEPIPYPLVTRVVKALGKAHVAPPSRLQSTARRST
jgi:uncharacterized protein YdhG (YjbR/CyaY superfamily)